MTRITYQACSHCAHGSCTRPGCTTCAGWQAATGSTECGVCQGTTVLRTGEPALAKASVRVSGDIPGIAAALRALRAAAPAGDSR